jgi:hydroxypyruvate isomerase
MAKFSLCIEPVLPELEFTERIRVAADLGFDAVEFWDPVGKDVAAIAKTASQVGIAVSICCVKSAWPMRMNAPADVVVANVRESLLVAQELGCPSLIGLSGDLDGRNEVQKAALVDNLKRAAELAEKAAVTITLEALNSAVDHKGYYLDSSAVGFEIVRSVGSDYIKLLYDVYHMQIMEGNIIDTVTRNIDLIGHFHSAGVPGRHEHFNGENDYPNILKAISAIKYDRYFGLEYWPTYDHRQSLKDVLAYLNS